MVVLNKIYTRTGDDGTTALGSGRRVAKYDLRVEAYGTLDETNAAIGIARLHTQDGHPRSTPCSRASRTICSISAPISASPTRPRTRAGRSQVTDAQVDTARKRDRRAQRELAALALLRAAGRLAGLELSASRPHHLAPRRAADGGACGQKGRDGRRAAPCAISIGCRISCSSRRASPTTRASRT